MHFDLLTQGAPSAETMRKAHQWWHEAATQHNVKLDGFDLQASLGQRMSWALQIGLAIAVLYTRFSTKFQHSTEDQVRECVEWAARNGMYVPPELICADEAISGKVRRRVGLERTKQILSARHATVLLVYKASRLSRNSSQGFQFIQEEVVEAGLRAVSVSEQIDTNERDRWKFALKTHGLVDEFLVDGISDHVRTALEGMFLNGWTTGALGVGYRRKVLPNAPPTKRGLPRTVPEVDPDVAVLLQEHAQLHLKGMSLTQGLRRWRLADGPCDPRSTTGQMTATAYRRLWSNIRFTGHWEFGRKRNQFSTKSDYVKQLEQPDSEVKFLHCEELRIFDDETFLALKLWLDGLKSGPRGPRKQTPPQLWDLTTELFFCAHCSQPDKLVRYYQTGAKGLAMQCKEGIFCSNKSAINRQEAVRVICNQLSELIARDAELVAAVICRSRELDAAGDDDLQQEIMALKNRNRSLTRRIEDLYKLVGQGTDDDRNEVQAQIRADQSERAQVRIELIRLNKELDRTTATLTPEQAHQILADTSILLENAANGGLGEDAVYKALAIFRRLTGGQILVHVERRPGRKRTNVRGVFRPQLLRAIAETAELSVSNQPAGEEVAVWLRRPPRLDALAERVHQLMDQDGLSYRDTATQLQREGHNVNSGNVWYSYRRWYEMNGLPVPKRPYNNGQRRKSA